MFTETFFVGLYSALMGFVLAVINLLYRSKCKEVDICCIKIVRDIQIEEELDLQQIRPNPIQSQNTLLLIFTCIHSCLLKHLDMFIYLSFYLFLIDPVYY